MILFFANYSKHGASTDQGTKITADYIDKILNEEAKKVKGVPEGQLETARKYMSAQVRVIFLSSTYHLPLSHNLLADMLSGESQAHSPQLSDFLTSDLMSHLADDAAPTRPAVAKGRL